MATAAGSNSKIDMGRVVQQGFEVIGRQIGPFLALGLLLSGLPAAFMNWFQLGSVSSGSPVGLGSPVYGLIWLVTVLTGYLVQAAIVRSSILLLAGRDANIVGSLAVALRYLLPMIGLAFLTTILVGIGLLLLVVPGVIVYLMLIVSVPALIEEKGGVFHAMRRSRELTKGSRGRIFLLLILFAIVYLIIAGVIGALGTALFDDNLLLASILQGLAASITAVLVSSMLAALYSELRSIKEGATVDGLAEIFS